MIPSPYEWQEQNALIQWASVANVPGEDCKIKDYLISIPNHGKRDILNGVHYKRGGLTKGIPDLFLAIPSHGYPGLWIEMKRRGKAYKAPKGAQLDVMTRFQGRGYKVVTCAGWDDARDVILDYLKGRVDLIS